MARRSEQARRAILSAALDLLGSVGYAKLTIEGIAARAGVGKQTIYRWWSSKGAVLLEAILDQTSGDAADPDALPDTGDLEADLKLVLRATVDELNDPMLGGAMRALNLEIQRDLDLAAKYATVVAEPMNERKRERLASAQQAGELRDDVDLGLVVDLVWGSLRGRWLDRTGPLTHDFADDLVEAVLYGLRPEGTRRE
jgi:AcrR family transcriptional regulator